MAPQIIETTERIEGGLETQLLFSSPLPSERLPISLKGQFFSSMRVVTRTVSPGIASVCVFTQMPTEKGVNNVELGELSKYSVDFAQYATAHEEVVGKIRTTYLNAIL